MAISKPELKRKAIMYDKVIEYFEKKKSFIFGWEETVYKETLKENVLLEISHLPDVVICNGKKYKLNKF